MKKKSFAIKSSFDGLTIKGMIYEPDGEYKGLVHILHGKSEYKERYEEFMQFLCKNGYVAACHDHRGHGDSVEKDEDRGWFHDFEGEAVVADAVAVTKALQKQYPSIPTVLYGHSMGSMIARCYIQKHDTLIDKVVLSGTPNANPLVGTAIFLAKTLRFFRGERHRSKTLDYLATGKGDKNFPNEGKGAWLSGNRENIAEFYSNPKGRILFTCNGFENLFKLLKNTYDTKRYAVENPEMPIHFISGDKDPVMGSVMDFTRAVEFMQDIGYENVTAKLYENLRHEIHNELTRQEVYDDILAFIDGSMQTITDEEDAEEKELEIQLSLSTGDFQPSEFQPSNFQPTDDEDEED